jgi:hypothetical protein
VDPRNTLKKGRLLSASFTMNLFSAAMWHVSFCTSFLVRGGCIWRNVFILLGMASIPLVKTRQPITLPRVTLKTHFSGLSLSLALCILVNFPSDRRCVKLSSCLLVRYHQRKRVHSYRLGPLMPPSSFYKMWDLHCAAPPAFSYSNMCRMVL